jgi:hypothetical protein
VGVLEAIGTDKPIPMRYGANHCPDKGAGGMFDYARAKGMPWGEIGTLPEIVGLALTMPGHIGYYVGNGYAIEWRGFAYGCVKTKVAGRGWTHWYALPMLQYPSATVPPAQPKPPEPPKRPDSDPLPVHTYGSRLLHYRQGNPALRGTDVVVVQHRLIALGFDPGKADGIYGAKVAAAVAAFQQVRGIRADGIVGPVTRRELGK